MPLNIQFLDCKPEYEFARDCLAVMAYVEGHPVTFRISCEFFWRAFDLRHLSGEEMIRAYQEHGETIRRICIDQVSVVWKGTGRVMSMTHPRTLQTM